VARLSVEATGTCVQSGYVGPSVDGYWQTPQRDLSVRARVGMDVQWLITTLPVTFKDPDGTILEYIHFNRQK
jgi:hypothetical protein